MLVNGYIGSCRKGFYFSLYSSLTHRIMRSTCDKCAFVGQGQCNYKTDWQFQKVNNHYLFLYGENKND